MLLTMKAFELVIEWKGSKTGRLVITGIIHFNHQVQETIEFVLLSLVLRQFETFTAQTDTTEKGSVPALTGLINSRLSLFTINPIIIFF